MGETRTDQLSFRVDQTLMNRLDKAAVTEDLKRADLARKIFAWAWKQYEQAGSLHALREERVGAQSRRVSDETQEQIFTALKTIFDRAPSTVIERVVEYLTERAGKYGEDKSGD
jgi:hypothetical protein